jgi:hypothetical protein
MGRRWTWLQKAGEAMTTQPVTIEYFALAYRGTACEKCRQCDSETEAYAQITAWWKEEPGLRYVLRRRIVPP